MKMLFSNKHFLVVDKDHGWLTTPARFADKDTRPVLGLQLQKNLGQKIYPVHRLDFEVSGIVLYALDAQAHQKANDLFENRRVAKTYQALSEAISDEKMQTDGIKLEEKLAWKCKILRGKKRSFESPHGKDSLTYSVAKGKIEHEKWGESFAWQLSPLTGRSHQLRFEMYRHGFPILGDSLYGSKVKTVQEHSIALRAVKLEILDSEFCKIFAFPPSVSVENPLF